MQRVTDKHLESLVDSINAITNSPSTPYTRENDRSHANIGNYHLSWAYGGVKLHRMVNEGGGIREALSTGYTTKRDLYDQLQAFIKGIEFAKDRA